jgi:hypothetical protein
MMKAIVVQNCTHCPIDVCPVYAPRFVPDITSPDCPLPDVPEPEKNESISSFNIRCVDLVTKLRGMK